MEIREAIKSLLVPLCIGLVVGLTASTVLLRHKAAKAAEVVEQNWHYTLANVSAYCASEVCCGRRYKDGVDEDGNRVTASGVPATGFLVAAPKSVPFGTKMAIPGYAGGDWVEVQDRGGAIVGNKIDLLMSSHEKALQWGRRLVTIKVMEREDE